jgi:hypothetical protein
VNFTSNIITRIGEPNNSIQYNKKLPAQMCAKLRNKSDVPFKQSADNNMSIPYSNNLLTTICQSHGNLFGSSPISSI